MSRLIDADKIDFNEVFVGASEFAQDTRNAAQMLIDKQPTAFDVDKISKELVKQKKNANKKMNESDDGYSMSYYAGFSSGLAIAIGIVKGDGIK